MQALQEKPKKEEKKVYGMAADLQKDKFIITLRCL
jgi:hypothetical protein